LGDLAQIAAILYAFEVISAPAFGFMRMRQIADLHIHSRYSRACSRDLNFGNIEKTCRAKGVDIVATGDFTYPDWFAGIRQELEEIGNSGLYRLKTSKDEKIKFLLSTELALIYKKGEKARRIHLVVHAPNIRAAEGLNKYLDAKYNIRADGRPILGMDAEKLVKLCLSIDPKFLVYPAHIWTPWFSVFGSKSGFDKLEECFGSETGSIYAYETGLSSDPEMNWRLSDLDKLTLLSNSDAHSLPNIGREANVFELKEVSYNTIYGVIARRSIAMARPSRDNGKDGITRNDNRLEYTIEFYPEEGMYHYDGHRACGVRFSPEETKKHQGICPVCKKPLTIGVMNRVGELADRPAGSKPAGAPGSRKLVELDKIIAEAMGIKSRNSKAVQTEYKHIVRHAGPELGVLIDASLEQLEEITTPEVVEGVRRVRAGELIIEPGFDGQYGTVKIFTDEERSDNQQSLF
jgi:uncharacterized protein (TIGR00375 family)